jgi:hypothetical protein
MRLLRQVREGMEPKRGKIISNDEDNGTEIIVRWDDGTKSGPLWCGKKGTDALQHI